MGPVTTGLAMAGLGASLAGGYLIPAVWKPLAIRRLQARCRSRRALVLTFDDGPSPIITPALLDLLAEFEAPATFFLTGDRVLPHSDLAYDLERRGHEVGCHGYHHLHAWKNRPGKLGDDFARGYDAAKSCGASDPISFRPPYGKLVFPTWLAAKRRGCRLAWWTHDSGDTFAELPGRSPALDLLHQGGGIALMHDLDRSARRNEFVLETTRALLEGARRHDLALLRFRDLFA
ncbi:MAG: peptidoglycan/xylan/chitin deacetylase (PgdA/CDA1 family) [Paracoccaceae bacterium]|jgi:peptidoglycan/xylan/chitin deacetylase (PgdA/CDA1 family)